MVPGIEKPVALETQGLQAKNDPIQPEQLTTICSDWVGSFNGRTVSPEHIFYSPEGNPYQPNNWANRVYRPFVKALHQEHPGIPELSPHELRHTRATLWIAQGIQPYMAARLLGHSDLKMLTKIYDHTSEDTLRNVLLQASGNLPDFTG